MGKLSCLQRLNKVTAEARKTDRQSSAQKPRFISIISRPQAYFVLSFQIGCFVMLTVSAGLGLQVSACALATPG